MDKNYDPKLVEQKWYQWWEESGGFTADPTADGDAYSVVIPPPNVTGILHMGHALNNTIQDVLVRWRRMQGRNTLWIPGTDHAGIATQNVVERALRQQNISRHDIGRENFLERVWQWRSEYGGTIVRQLRKLGASCDWSRERFTMDEGLSAAVTEVFCRLYDEGLIYRGNYIVNWCPRCHTALSDEESEHEDTQGSLWHIRYPIAEGGAVVVATTRPETMLGDTAVAVNPADERYRRIIGAKVILPLLEREIPVVADDYVDREFGTGVVKITPAHDPNDFQVALRHQLEMPNVMTGEATMNELAGPYAGLDRFECRKRVVADLEERGLLVKTEPHQHAVGHCYRCHTVVEPRLSQQWFVRMKPLAEPAIQAVRSGKVRFTPQRWEKTYFEWMENIRDWCISRQIWWGHRIPVYTCEKCHHEWAARHAPRECPECAHSRFTQDPDVLDTWFSSWLWPFTTFGWPENTADLNRYYPTRDLATAPEIIFFWVARMIMAGCKFMGEAPFRNVYIHGTVRDTQGRKMSKSLGNSIDPLDIIEKYSADSLRFSLMLITSTGMDVYVNMEKFEIGRNFATKIWNAARFIKMHTEKAVSFTPRSFATGEPTLEHAMLSDDERHLLNRCDTTIRSMGEHLRNFRLQDGALTIYNFIWSEFCDWHLEYAKQQLYGNVEERRLHALSILHTVFAKSLKLLHPYMPFITEELWHEMGYGNAQESIMVAPWPEPLPEATRTAWGVQNSVSEFVAARRELATAARALRAEFNLPPARTANFIIQAVDNETAARLKDHLAILKTQIHADEIRIVPHDAPVPAAPGAICVLGTINMLPDGVIDIEAETRRVKQELEKSESYLKATEAKLNNRGFLTKAPPAVIEQQREKLAELSKKTARLRNLLDSFGGK